jgi:hypothetical protein
MFIQSINQFLCSNLQIGHLCDSFNNHLSIYQYIIKESIEYDVNIFTILQFKIHTKS